MTHREQAIRTVKLADARAHFGELVAQAAAGEEILITRHGRPVARLCGLEKTKVRLASRARFRAQLLPLAQPSAALIRSLRGNGR